MADGTRVVTVWHEADGGARALAGFYDLELDVECQWIPVEGAPMRCLPPWGKGRFAYGDPACTVPVIVLEAGVPAEERPRVWAQGSTRSCEHTVVVKALVEPGAPLEARPETLYRRDEDAECHSYGVGFDAWTAHHAIPVPAEAFLGGHLESIPIEGGLDAQVVRADDGGRSLRDVVDRKRGVTCRAQETSTDGVVCIPVLQAYYSPWNETTESEDCTGEPLAHHGAPECGTPEFAVDYSGGGCSPPPLRIVDGPVERAFAIDGSGTCQEVLGEAQYFRVGGTIDPRRHPSLDRVQLGRGTTVEINRTPGGTQLGSYLGWHRGEHNCSFVPLHDDAYVCEPRLTTEREFYATSDCTGEPIWGHWDPPICGRAPVEDILLGVEDGGRLVEVYRSVPHDGPAYQVEDDGTCALEDGQYYSFHTRGDAASIDKLPIVRERRGQ